MMSGEVKKMRTRLTNGLVLSLTWGGTISFLIFVNVSPKAGLISWAISFLIGMSVGPQKNQVNQQKNQKNMRGDAGKDNHDSHYRYKDPWENDSVWDKSAEGGYSIDYNRIGKD